MFRQPLSLSLEAVGTSSLPSMPLNYDEAVTAFWFGVAFLNLSFIRRSWSLQSLFVVFVVWFAVFPVFESAVRSILRSIFVLHPQRLWGLSIVSTLPYLLAVAVLAARWSRRLPPSSGT